MKILLADEMVRRAIEKIESKNCLDVGEALDNVLEDTRNWGSDYVTAENDWEISNKEYKILVERVKNGLSIE